LRKECTYITKNMQAASVELAYSRLPAHPLIKNNDKMTYKEDLLTSILHYVFVNDRVIRSQQAFEQSLQQNKAELLTVANEAGKLAQDIMTLYSAVKASLQRFNANDPMAKDINEQLSFLIYQSFIRNTPYSDLKAIPRYLKAIQYRLDKLDNSQQKIQEVARYTTRFWKEVEFKSQKDTVLPEQDPFRWMLEEFRVSLFAQQLKTAYPISVKRMDKAWDERC